MFDSYSFLVGLLSYPRMMLVVYTHCLSCDQSEPIRRSVLDFVSTLDRAFCFHFRVRSKGWSGLGNPVWSVWWGYLATDEMMRVEALSLRREMQSCHQVTCEYRGGAKWSWVKRWYQVTVKHTCNDRKRRLEEKALIWPNCGNEEEKGVKKRRENEWSGWAWPWPDHRGKKHILRVHVLYNLLYWRTVCLTATFPDTYGGMLAALQCCQRPDEGKLNI